MEDIAEQMAKSRRLDDALELRREVRRLSSDGVAASMATGAAQTGRASLPSRWTARPLPTVSRATVRTDSPGDRSPADDGPAHGGGTDVSDTLPPPQTPRGDDGPPTYVAPFKLTHPDLRRKPGPLAPVIFWCPATLKRAPAGLS